MDGKRQFVAQIPDGGLQIGLPARLDFAAYRLNDKTDAFGLRLQNTVGYAGGGSLEEFMVLFAVIEGRLKPVLNANTFTLENIAGSWNKDGTRQHDVYTDTYILKMSPQQHNGFYDIIGERKALKTVNGKSTAGMRKNRSMAVWNSGAVGCHTGWRIGGTASCESSWYGVLPDWESNLFRF